METIAGLMTEVGSCSYARVKSLLTVELKMAKMNNVIKEKKYRKNH